MAEIHEIGTAKPQQNVIEAIENLLVKAGEGKIISIAYATVETEAQYSEGYFYGEDGSYPIILLGALDACRMKIHRYLVEQD